VSLAKLIAKWIIHHCDEPVDEVAYILYKAYPGEKKAEMNEEYLGVIEYLRDLDNPEYNAILNYLDKELQKLQ
tara:strand:- start:249 stop:467 length:219 start_codon:yes stop_codon:yes gene_type:complete